MTNQVRDTVNVSVVLTIAEREALGRESVREDRSMSDILRNSWLDHARRCQPKVATVLAALRQKRHERQLENHAAQLNLGFHFAA